MAPLLEEEGNVSCAPVEKTISDASTAASEGESESEQSGGERSTIVEPEEEKSAPEPLSDVFLSKLLKMGTQGAHKAAESGTFVKRLLRGRVPAEEYRLLVVDFVHVYDALESCMEVAANEKQCRVVQEIHKPVQLNRLDSLHKDLEHWSKVTGKEAAVKPSKPAQEYAARIREVVETAPHLLLAHAYTRYLGDLSGGSVIRRSIVRALAVGPNDEGVAFYDFENVPDAKSFKQKYRDALDCLDLPATMAEEIVEEANKAFDFNAQIFQHLDDLAGVAKEAPATELQEASASRPREVELPDGHPPVQEGQTKFQCPFAALAAGIAADERAYEMKKKLAAMASASAVARAHEQKPTGPAPWKVKAAWAMLAAAGALLANAVPLS